uniref:Glycine rich superfamily member n=1 Tax=Rhipicephalus appendiculatus TaxID=34631 RepID=A0A131YYN7_RHIAP
MLPPKHQNKPSLTSLTTKYGRCLALCVRCDCKKGVHNTRPPLCKDREHIREEERQQQIDDAMNDYKLERAPMSAITDLQQRLLALEKELGRLRQAGKRETPLVAVTTSDSVPKNVHVNLVEQYKKIQIDFRILKSNHEQLMKRLEDRNSAILEADETIFERRNSASDVRHRTPSPQRNGDASVKEGSVHSNAASDVESNSAEPENDEEMNSSSDSEESSRNDSNAPKIGSVGDNGKLYAGRGFWICKQDWSKLFSAPTDSMFCKFAASLFWTREELQDRSVTGTLSIRDASSGKCNSRLPLTPEKLNTLKGLFRHYVGKDPLAQQRLKAVRRHLAIGLYDIRRPTVRSLSSSDRGSVSVPQSKSSAASPPACDDESIDDQDLDSSPSELGSGQTELGGSQCEQDRGQQTIIGSSRDDGKVYAGCGRWVDRECWDALMRSSNDSIFCRSACSVYWTTEQMKCRSVTGALSNKCKSLGLKKPKRALTPEKLNCLKALFHIYMGDETPADIADKRLKNVRRHLAQKLADLRR